MSERSDLFGVSPAAAAAIGKEPFLFPRLPGTDITRRGFCVSLAALPVAGAAAAAPSVAATAPIAPDAFLNPPDDCRPHAIWMWMGANVSRAGITRDLEEYRAKGLGGVCIMPLADIVDPNPGAIQGNPTPEVIAFTPPWFALLRHACDEANRLGLTVAVSNCPGYASTGGPWIPVEKSMKQLVWFTREVEGAQRFKGRVERTPLDPHPQGPFPLTWLPDQKKIGWPDIPERNSFFRDVALLAMPATGDLIPERIVDLTDRMAADGTFAWDAPPGRWLVYRFGYTTTGMFTSPCQWQARGFEVDKLDAQAIDFHIMTVVGMLREHLGDLVGPVLNALHFDSYEAGDQNWTGAMPEEFERRRGYPLRTWLPALAGRRITGGPKGRNSDGVKADMTRTIREMFQDIYFPRLNARVGEAGLIFSAEAYEGQFDPTIATTAVARPMGEFWTRDRYDPWHLDEVVAGARAAGRSIIAGEALTSGPDHPNTLWRETPAWLKPVADAAFCAGINAFFLHQFTHQPWSDAIVPGATMGQWGIHFGRNQTWWPQSGGFFRYLARCQHMLRRGAWVSPEAYAGARFTGDGAGELRSIRRRDGETDIHFVSNQSRTEAATVTARLPGTGRQPEWWDALDGSVRDLSEYRFEGGDTLVPLELAPAGSAFLVLRRPVAGAGRGRNAAPARAAATIDGPWMVDFPATRWGPGTLALPTLIDWTTHGDRDVRHFSGTATYETRFRLPTGMAGRALRLDLGAVRHVAEVWLNGVSLGTVWTAPWSVALGAAARAGDNDLRIAVTNCWANRLIGDEDYPADCEWGPINDYHKAGRPLVTLPRWVHAGGVRPEPRRRTFATWNYFADSHPALDPSGLLGPVRIVAA